MCFHNYKCEFKDKTQCCVTLYVTTSKYEVIFQALSIAEIKPATSISQTLRNEPMTTRLTTPIVTTTHFFTRGGDTIYKHDINKIELQVEADISNFKFYEYLMSSFT